MNNQDLMFQSRNVEARIIKWQLSLFDTYDRQGAMMERKTRYEVQELLVAEYETDGSMKFITMKI